jgi:phenylalanyl-tRNA synthetase alpha chain
MEVTKGPNFKLSLEKQEIELTADLIASGEWKTKSFKQYNFNAQGIQPVSGCLHPLLKVRAEFRDIFFQMGFSGWLLLLILIISLRNAD